MTSKQQALDSLWDAYVFRFLSKAPETDIERRQGALDVLEMYRLLAAKDDLDDETARGIYAGALVVWQLLAVEVGELLLRLSPTSNVQEQIVQLDQPVRNQFTLRSLLEFQMIGGPPGLRDSLDPTAVVIPRSLARELLDGISSLAKGETTEILRPKSNGRHGAAAMRDKMRLRALEHVAFLVGKGVTKKIARRRVGQAMGNVATETLRDWEERECANSIHGLEEKLRTAKNAGELADRLQRDPEYGGRPGESVDAHEFHLAEELSRRETLEVFGRQYKSVFGGRHYSAVANDQ